MSIQQQLAMELRDAIRTKDGPRRDVIRQVQTEIAIARSEPGFSGEADDALFEKVIASYVKKMDKARAEYAELGDRGGAMADKLAYEVSYLSRWLPQTLSEDETRKLVVDAISELGVTGDEKAAGRVTGHLMKHRGTELDGALVNRLVRETLASG